MEERDGMTDDQHMCSSTAGNSSSHMICQGYDGIWMDSWVS